MCFVASSTSTILGLRVVFAMRYGNMSWQSRSTTSCQSFAELRRPDAATGVCFGSPFSCSNKANQLCWCFPLAVSDVTSDGLLWSWYWPLNSSLDMPTISVHVIFLCTAYGHYITKEKQSWTKFWKSNMALCSRMCFYLGDHPVTPKIHLAKLYVLENHCFKACSKHIPDFT